jgi:hypothetical protein
MIATDFAGISSALWAFAAVLGQIAVLIGLFFNRKKVQGVQDTVNGAALRQEKRIDSLHKRLSEAEKNK